MMIFLVVLGIVTAAVLSAFALKRQADDYARKDQFSDKELDAWLETLRGQ